MTTTNQLQHPDVTESSVPSFGVFREEIKKIYPEGDLDRTYKRLLWYIENEKTCSDGTPITYKLIISKFAAHIKAWNAMYAVRDPKYLGKDSEEKRKNLFDFIGMHWYEREFVAYSGGGDRNKYLFGDFTIDYLSNQLMAIKKRLQNEEK